MKSLLTCLLAIVILSCGPKKESLTAASSPKSFPMIEVPAMLTATDQRAEFVVLHYWDKFQFNDTTYIALPDVTEQAFVDYITLFPHVPFPTAQRAIKSMLTASAVNPVMLKYIASLYDKYLYDPNSPFRNEEYYISVLEYEIASPAISPALQSTAKFRLNMALKNRFGTQATNITYTLASGSTGTLHALKQPYTLFYLYNPGCHACEEVAAQISKSETFTNLIATKQLAILALYVDEDLENWKKHASQIPTTWINGYDKQLLIRSKDLYDLKAIPTLYLLGKNKEVLLKDATFQQVEQFLNANK